MEVVVIGTLSRPRDELKPIIEKMGGKLVTKLHPKTAVVLSTQAQVDKMSKRMQEVQRNDIQVCTEDFLDNIRDGGTLDYIAKNSICDWGSDVGVQCGFILCVVNLTFNNRRLPFQPNTRIDQNEPSLKVSKSLYTRSVPTSVKLKLVGKLRSNVFPFLDIFFNLSSESRSNNLCISKFYFFSLLLIVYKHFNYKYLNSRSFPV